MFCPELQKIIKTDIQFNQKCVDNSYGGNEQQSAFEEIKHRFIQPPILHMPNHEGRFHLYPDMSKLALWDSTLYQIQSGKTKINSLCE